MRQVCSLGPVEAFPHLQPAKGGLFSLLGAEAKLVFPRRSGIVPQKHTMQLLKYLGLAGQPHSGPLFPSPKAGFSRSRVGSVPLLAVCWTGAGVLLQLWGSPQRKEMYDTHLQLCRMARSVKVPT